MGERRGGELMRTLSRAGDAAVPEAAFLTSTRASLSRARSTCLSQPIPTQDLYVLIVGITRDSSKQHCLSSRGWLQRWSLCSRADNAEKRSRCLNFTDFTVDIDPQLRLIQSIKRLQECKDVLSAELCTLDRCGGWPHRIELLC
jgi:hypothetical protein